MSSMRSSSRAAVIESSSSSAARRASSASASVIVASSGSEPWKSRSAAWHSLSASPAAAGSTGASLTGT